MPMLLPGPVRTHPEVLAAMARDIAPWHDEFKNIYSSLLDQLVLISGGNTRDHVAITYPGPGHMTLEAAIRTFVPRSRSVVVLCNGQYAAGLAKLADRCDRPAIRLLSQDDQPVGPAELDSFLSLNPDVTHVLMVHHETSTGIINDADLIGRVVSSHGRRLILDSISAFGVIPFSMEDHPECDCVVFTSGKCLAGPPGVGGVVCNRDSLGAAAGNADSWCMDLHDALAVMAAGGPGTHRFTPAAQVILGFHRAVERYISAGGQPVYHSRCRSLSEIVRRGVTGIGLVPYLSEEHQGPIVVVVHQPRDVSFRMEEFVTRLSAEGVTISGFHGAILPTFRIGCIGETSPDDVDRCLTTMSKVLKDMGVCDLMPAAPAA